MSGYIAPELTAPADGVVQSSGTFAMQPNETPQVIITNGNISLAGGLFPDKTAGVVVVAPAGAVTGITIDLGLVGGQMLLVENLGAGSVTFAAVGTSHVQDGASDVIAVNTVAMFVWNATNSVWVRIP